MTEQQMTRAVRRGVIQAFFHLIFYSAMIGVVVWGVVAIVVLRNPL